MGLTRSSKAASRGEELILQIKSMLMLSIIPEDKGKTRQAGSLNLTLINVLVLIKLIIISRILCALAKIIDIAERNLAEGMLEDSEKQYNPILNSINNGMMLHFVTCKSFPNESTQANEVNCKCKARPRRQSGLSSWTSRRRDDEKLERFPRWQRDDFVQ